MLVSAVCIVGAALLALWSNSIVEDIYYAQTTNVASASEWAYDESWDDGASVLKPLTGSWADILFLVGVVSGVGAIVLGGVADAFRRYHR